MKKRHGNIIALGLAAGFIFAAAPIYAASMSSAPNEPSFAGTNQMLAQASEPGIEAQEQQLLNQIDSDIAKLKADEAAENAHHKPINPQRKWIHDAILHLRGTVVALAHTTNHYSGHKGLALKALQEAHNQLMVCYRIDSR